jgi:hypothetical protein
MLENFLPFVGLIAIGFFAGAYGALIGAGGGFILVSQKTRRVDYTQPCPGLGV